MDKTTVSIEKIEEIKRKITELNHEPQYLHEGEDWSVGLEMALDVIDEVLGN